MLSDSAKQLQDMLTTLDTCSNKTGLKINLHRTKIMVSTDDVEVETVNEHVYLRLDCEIKKCGCVLRVSYTSNVYYLFLRKARKQVFAKTIMKEDQDDTNMTRKVTVEHQASGLKII